MHTVLLVIQMVLALILVILITIQEKAGGLGEAISGIGGTPIQTKKRGAEKVLSQATILSVVLFLGLSLALNFVQ